MYLTSKGILRVKEEYESENGYTLRVVLLSLLFLVPILFVVVVIAKVLLNTLFGYEINYVVGISIVIVSYLVSLVLTCLGVMMFVYFPRNNLLLVENILSSPGRVYVMLKVGFVMCSVGKSMTFPQVLLQSVAFFVRISVCSFIVAFFWFGHAEQRAICTGVSVGIGFSIVDIVSIVVVLFQRDCKTQVECERYFTMQIV